MAYRENSQLDALGDATRRAIVERLVHGALAVCDIARGLPVSRPAVSQHLKVLKTARLVACQTLGTRRFYHLDQRGLAIIRRYFDRFWGNALESYRTAVEQAAAEALINQHAGHLPSSGKDKA